MKIIKLLFTLLLISIIFSCGRQESDEPTPIPVVPGDNLNITYKVTKDIYPTYVKFEGSITQDPTSTRTPGFVYSMNPNPTVGNNAQVTKFVTGSVNFEVFSMDLQPNKSYYVRGFVQKSDGTYLYTPESTFKTTGYFGPGGGYVAYDKGEYTNGWRYMEIHPVSLNYSSAGYGSKWGNPGQFISGTYPDFGKGKENTDIIVNATSAADCAAKLCKNLVRNGFNDWFLPSSEELIIMSLELKKANIAIPTSAWSSTETNLNFARSTYAPLSQPSTPILTDGSKGIATGVLPARRY